MTRKLTKSQTKFIKSLKQKKCRDESKSFVVEGVKLVNEALSSGAQVDTLVYTKDSSPYPFKLSEHSFSASQKELSMISSQKTPNKILAVCRHPKWPPISFSKPLIVLDTISDPGNLGTIIRLCDWFGFDQLLCTPNSVDCYNPKVVQATMGSIFRVAVHYADIEASLASKPPSVSLFAADTHGKNLFDVHDPGNFVLIMGSESHGIKEEIFKLSPERITIPKTGNGESLNLAISTGIIAAHFRRVLSAK